MVELHLNICELCKKEKRCYRVLEDKSIKSFCQECLNNPENSHLKEKFKEQISCEWKEV